MRKTKKARKAQTKSEPQTFDQYLRSGGVGNVKYVAAAMRERGVPFAQSYSDDDTETLFISRDNSYLCNDDVFREYLLEKLDLLLRVISTSQGWFMLKRKRINLLEEMADHYEQFISTDEIYEDKLYSIIFKVMSYYGYEIRNS